MKIINDKILLQELQTMAEKNFGRLVKAVVDVQKELMVINAEMHADQEEFLLEQGSKQGDIWRINLHPFVQDDTWIEFDSMINIRPSWGNRTRSVDDLSIQKKIITIVTRLVKKC